MDAVQILNNLLQGEQDNIFRFMGDGSPYVGHRLGELRKPLQEMIDDNASHSADLWVLIDNLGGVFIDSGPRSIQRDEQYFAFLRLGYFLPKLIEEKQRQILRYETAITQLGKSFPDITAVLNSHLADHRRHLQTLLHAQSQLPPTTAPAKTIAKPGDLPPVAAVSTD